MDGLLPDVQGLQMALLLQKDFGERLRALRVSAERSQEEFAAMVNIDRATYGKLERGEINPSLITLARIAVALETSLSGLLNGIKLDADEVRKIPRSARGRTPIAGRPRQTGVALKNRRESTPDGTDRERDQAASAGWDEATAPRRGLNPSGPKVPSTPQK